MSRGSPQRVDAVVVGAGIIGLACAWRIAQRGLSVRVLEREARPGAGASDVAAGMLAPVGEAAWGEEGLLELALASHRAWPAFAAELAEASGAQVGHRDLGALYVALDRDEAEALRRRHELISAHGLDAEWLRPRAARELEPGLSSRLAAAVHAPYEAAAEPRLLVGALVGALQAAGGELVKGAEVARALIEGDRLTGVRTTEGAEHRAGAVVLAGGAWSNADWLPDEARPPVRPVKGQILTLRSDAPVVGRIVSTERVYMVPRPDGRLVVGATVEEQGFDTKVTAGAVHELLREAYRVLPGVAEMELVAAVAGLRPGTPDNAPLIGGAAIEGLVLATGHHRNGILLAPITADAVAASIAGDAPPLQLEVADPGRFGPLGEAAAPAGLASVR